MTELRCLIPASSWIVVRQALRNGLLLYRGERRSSSGGTGSFQPPPLTPAPWYQRGAQMNGNGGPQHQHAAEEPHPSAKMNGLHAGGGSGQAAIEMVEGGGTGEQHRERQPNPFGFDAFGTRVQGAPQPTLPRLSGATGSRPPLPHAGHRQAGQVRAPSPFALHALQRMSRHSCTMSVCS